MATGTTEAGGAIRVIVIGGGFAGSACTRRLARSGGTQVTLLDRSGTQEFTPLLYQVATAELAPDDARFDLARRFHRHGQVEVRTAEVAALDPRAHRVTLASGETLDGDVVVLAAGAQPNFFHTDGAARYAYPLYSLAGAERIRDRLLELLRHPPGGGPARIVIVGGGPTGVETAGAIADLIDDVAPHLSEFDTAEPAEVLLFDHGRELLAEFSPESRSHATNRLQERGVRVRFGISVRQVGADHVVLADGSTVATGLTVWAGGQAAAPLVAAAGLPTGAGGRVDVRPDLSVAGLPGVYAVGDAANIPDGTGTLPQLGSVAVQSGDWAAQNILAARGGDPAASGEPFRYHDKGILAMVDRQAAVAELGRHRREIHGRPAFAAWLALHADLLHNVHAELDALTRWADEFYLRPHHRADALLHPATVDTPRLRSPEHQEV